MSFHVIFWTDEDGSGDDDDCTGREALTFGEACAGEFTENQILKFNGICAWLSCYCVFVYIGCFYPTYHTNDTNVHICGPYIS